MDIMNTIQIIMTGIGVLTSVLAFISPFTKNTWDDKLLIALKSFLNGVKINKDDKTILMTLRVK